MGGEKAIPEEHSLTATYPHVQGKKAPKAAMVQLVVGHSCDHENERQLGLDQLAKDKTCQEEGHWVQ